MNQDKKKKVIPPPIGTYISPQTRQNIWQACSNVVATPEELASKILVPFPECLRRLREMGAAAQSKKDIAQSSRLSESKADVKKVPTLGVSMEDGAIVTAFSETTECVNNVHLIKIEGTPAASDIKPTGRLLSQMIVDRMNLALLSMQCRVTPLFPPDLTTNKTIPKVIRRRGPPIPQLGRLAPKRKMFALVNTTQKPRSDDMQTAGKGLTNEGTEPLSENTSAIEDHAAVFGDIQMKVELIELDSN
ncbi:uncharacterized protein LOC119076712 [Bradysia coprophila]|uniref:uncharacterized protein LOC119076712 n=1 Tax=Bradysia coprophila TaxID=38358 RepID=UPI00187DA33B|nr:uncharacterized protein LOC119076712 [Bradysia coprophila]